MSREQKEVRVPRWGDRHGAQWRLGSLENRSEPCNDVGLRMVCVKRLECVFIVQAESSAGKIALGIGIDDEHALPVLCHSPAEVERGRSLAHAPLVVK